MWDFVNMDKNILNVNIKKSVKNLPGYIKVEGLIDEGKLFFLNKKKTRIILKINEIRQCVGMPCS